MTVRRWIYKAIDRCGDSYRDRMDNW